MLDRLPRGLLQLEGLAVLVGALVLYFDADFGWLALIWLAHIGMDRALGYGLKYPEGFKTTHLQRV